MARVPCQYLQHFRRGETSKVVAFTLDLSSLLCSEEMRAGQLLQAGGLQFLQPQNSPVASLPPWDSAQPEADQIEGLTDQLLHKLYGANA